MKKTNFNQKLFLKKETVASLSNGKMNKILGGKQEPKLPIVTGPPDYYPDCDSQTRRMPCNALMEDPRL